LFVKHVHGKIILAGKLGRLIKVDNKNDSKIVVVKYKKGKENG